MLHRLFVFPDKDSMRYFFLVTERFIVVLFFVLFFVFFFFPGFSLLTINIVNSWGENAGRIARVRDQQTRGHGVRSTWKTGTGYRLGDMRTSAGVWK